MSDTITPGHHYARVLIRRFDERGGWLKWSFPTCAEWLHWRCDLSFSAAREKVRVARDDNEDMLLLCNPPPFAGISGDPTE